MKGLILVVLAIGVTVSAIDVDWSKVVPRYLELDIPDWIKYRAAPSGQGRIVGGNEAVPHSFPSMVGLLLKFPEGLSFCGASLISDQYVLTAAHCVSGCLGATLVFGAHRAFDSTENHFEMEVDKSAFIIHEGYSNANNDIALIKLLKPVPLSANIQTIRLPALSDAAKSFQDEPAIAAGWGKTSDNSTVSPVLRYIETSIYNLLFCKISMLFLPTNDNICIGGKEGISTCNGDSGGPLTVAEADGKPTQVGLTSFGLSFGCEANMPVAFTRITSYLAWIVKNSDIVLRN